MILPPGVWSNVDRVVETFPPEWIDVARGIFEKLRGEAITDIAISRGETLVAILEDDGNVHVKVSSVFRGVELERAILVTANGV